VGTLAPAAAAVIHSDFEKAFVRADTIAYADFVAHGGEEGAKRLKREGLSIEDEMAFLIKLVVASGGVASMLDGWTIRRISRGDKMYFDPDGVKMISRLQVVRHLHLDMHASAHHGALPLLFTGGAPSPPRRGGGQAQSEGRGGAAQAREAGGEACGESDCDLMLSDCDLMLSDCDLMISDCEEKRAVTEWAEPRAMPLALALARLARRHLAQRPPRRWPPHALPRAPDALPRAPDALPAAESVCGRSARLSAEDL
jgi:hypothetical protein